jgi:hypothetical protein
LQHYRSSTLSFSTALTPGEAVEDRGNERPAP